MKGNKIVDEIISHLYKYGNRKDTVEKYGKVIDNFMKNENEEGVKSVTLGKILAVVSEVTKISVEDIKSKKQSPILVRARRLYYVIASKFSFESQGVQAGLVNQKHSTLIASIRMHDEVSDKKFKDEIDLLYIQEAKEIEDLIDDFIE